MKYQELMKEVEGVGKLKLSEQENFYRDVLNESSNDLEVRVAATFYLGMAYYYEGNFNKAKEIIEPIILQYQSMPFVRELISAFNLMGVMLYYDGANVSSRYYYEKALQIAMEHEDVVGSVPSSGRMRTESLTASSLLMYEFGSLRSPNTRASYLQASTHAGC